MRCSSSKCITAQPTAPGARPDAPPPPPLCRGLPPPASCTPQATAAAATGGGIRATKSAAELVAANVLDGYAETGTAEHKARRAPGASAGRALPRAPAAAHARELAGQSGLSLSHVGCASTAGPQAPPGGVGPCRVCVCVCARWEGWNVAGRRWTGTLPAHPPTRPTCPTSHPAHSHATRYWHRGSTGLRPEGHDYEDEASRLHEMEQVRRWGRC